MRIAITGANGFVGREVRRHLSGNDLVCIDSNLGGAPGLEGDIRDRALLDAAFAGGCDAVVHLATIPGGAAEADPRLAWEVNVDASGALIECAAAAGDRPRFIFASSIAVFGDLPGHVDDSTPTAPRMLYGAHKAMIEQYLETQTRRGAVSGVALRFPGIVARPQAPSGMKSAFMSNVFHHILSETPLAVPVSPMATMWLMSVRRAAVQLVHAINGEDTGAVTLPSLRCTMADLVDEIARASERSANVINYAPDASIEAAFGRQPPLLTKKAEARGYTASESLHALVQSALATIAESPENEARN